MLNPTRINSTLNVLCLVAEAVRCQDQWTYAKSDAFLTGIFKEVCRLFFTSFYRLLIFLKIYMKMNKYRMTPSVMKWVHYDTPLNDILNMDTNLMFKFSKNLLTFLNVEFEAGLRWRHVTRIKRIAFTAHLVFASCSCCWRSARTRRSTGCATHCSTMTSTGSTCSRSPPRCSSFTVTPPMPSPVRLHYKLTLSSHYVTLWSMNYVVWFCGTKKRTMYSI